MQLSIYDEIGDASIETSIEAQRKAILRYLQSGNSLTAMEALSRFGCARLAARIYDIKQDGHNIAKEMIYKGKAGFARYFLITSDNSNG